MTSRTETAAPKHATPITGARGSRATPPESPELFALLDDFTLTVPVVEPKPER